ncbi:MAG TPA: 50S ribosomal protein L18 [Nitrospirae bacterium]|nr:50S ribosomal protein L18 [bacterium BMS3Abin10]GBE38713.1 50S ribosomal protein L18 [bacterium BMS3Bbin08]HDK41173.1 50S ribosomal protein L18 [Nitrospirota bacterium]HDK82228.1 50S ribosomal protein L18 [Nitrospirota bacterium]
MRGSKEEARGRRHNRIKKKIYGTTERPRLNVFRSLNHIYAQIIDDSSGRVLVAAGSMDKEFKGKLKSGGNIEAAKQVGALVAKRAEGKGIKKVCFDRGGYLYHGRVKALAEASREEGLEF